MADSAAFTFLLMYLYSAHGFLSLGHLGSTTTQSSTCGRLIQLSGDQPLDITTCWHTTNNQSTTTTARQHAPKKHVCKKHMLLASTVKWELRGQHSGALSEADGPEFHYSVSHQNQRGNWYFTHNHNQHWTIASRTIIVHGGCAKGDER